MPAICILGLVFLLAGGCRLAGPTEGVAPPAPGADGPALVAGVPDPADAREVARILSEGETLLAEGRFSEALGRAEEIELRFSTADGSARALLLRARALRGLEDWTGSDAAIARYLPLLTPGEGLYAEALLFRAEVRWDGDLGGGIETLFQLPAGSPDDVWTQAEAHAVNWAGSLETSALRDLIAEAPRHPRLLPAFLVELAERRHLMGAETEARALAEEALGLEGGVETVERARSVLDGSIDERFAATAVIGALLPESGSPSVLELAREIREGIEIALVVEEATTGQPVRFVAANATSSAAGLQAALATLEGERVAAVIGPLEDVSVGTVASARTGTIPILSPTARMIPEGTGGVFTLTGVDPEAGRALAALVLGQGHRQVVLLHPASAETFEEARWFRDAYQAGGGTITRTLTYPVGTTSLAEPLVEVVRLAPRGLVLILPQGDIQTLAPQMGFYGVDAIEGLTVFGNESWVTQPVLQSVPTRHTNGVLAVTSWATEGEYGPGWNEFVSSYEQHFQRTLRSPVPALGYDSARLLIRAVREGGGTPEGTLRAFQEIRDFQGATGILSVVDGRLHRSYIPVRLENRRAIPLSP